MKRTYEDMGETTSSRSGPTNSNFKYLIFSLTNEEFTIHPKTVKVKCPRKIYYLWIYGYRYQTSGG